MSAISIKVDSTNLINFAEAGKVTFTELKEAMRPVANMGRTSVRQGISSSFVNRTGRLRSDARRIRTTNTAKETKVSAKVGPMPRLLNIFEHGATIPRLTIGVPGKRGGTAKAFHFLHAGGDGGFARGKIIGGGGHLSARPIMGPALMKMEATAVAEITKVLDRIDKR